MRTTVRLDDDVAAEVARLREQESIGLNEAINTLIRRSLTTPTAEPRPYQHRSRDMGMLVDVANIGEALELVEGPDHR